MSLLIRTHLLCPYFDCIAHSRKNIPRIQAVVDEERRVRLRKPISTEITRTRLPYLHKHWVRPEKCPYCKKPVEVVIDETHIGRHIYLRIPKTML